MITGKQRAHLRGLANPMETILQVGKSGVTEAVLQQVDDALTARELIKMRVLETSPSSSRATAQELAAHLHADIVQVIGSRFVLYRPHPKTPKIRLQ